MRTIFWALMFMIAAGAVIHAFHHHSASSPAVAAAGPEFTINAAASYCQATPATRTIACSISVRNHTDAADVPTVYALYRYSDGTSSADYSTNGDCRASDAIPAHSAGFVFFCHPYNAWEHRLVAAAASLDNNTYRAVRVGAPS